LLKPFVTGPSAYGLQPGIYIGTHLIIGTMRARREEPKLTRARKRAIRRQAEVEVELQDKKRQRLLVLAPTAFVLIVILGYFSWAIQAEIAKRPLIASTFGFFYQETTTVTVVGLFIVILVDTLFFVIFPGELYFFLAIAHDMNPVVAISAAALGGTIGQIANYWMGRYARRRGKDRPRAAKLLRFAEKANGRGGTSFIAFALMTPSPEIIGFAYGLGNFPAKKFAKMAAIFRPIKWILLFIAFVYLRQYLGILGF
jgi:membrane protein YqaA with SNARE-associated domain